MITDPMECDVQPRAQPQPPRTAAPRSAAAALLALAMLGGCGGSPGDAGAPPLDVAQRTAAATATAQGNAQCVGIRPFYWEIGDRASVLASGSVTRPGGPSVSGSDVMSIASASKWLYSTYYLERTLGALTPTDVDFLTFRSGYSSLSTCMGATTVAECLDLDNGRGSTNGAYNPASAGKFDYNGGHMQRHAADIGLGALDAVGLAAEMKSKLGADIELAFGQPQLAGGAHMSATDYAKVLRKILDGTLLMNSALGTYAVCTDPASCPQAVSTPSPKGERWHYSLGHWIEDDPVIGDGAFSSTGAFGFYPWIDRSKTYYGVVARLDLLGAVDSVDCGRLIRKAWVSGTAQ